MQDGGNDQPRSGANSALDDVRAANADRFGRKGSSETDGGETVSNQPSQPASETSGIENVEQSELTPAEPSADSAEDSLDLVETEPEPAEPANAETGDAETGYAETGDAETGDAEPTVNTRPVEAEVRMCDGATYVGKIYIREDERVLDYLNSPNPFFALIETSGKVRLLSKTQAIQIVPYDKGDINAAAMRGGGSLM